MQSSFNRQLSFQSNNSEGGKLKSFKNLIIGTNYSSTKKPIFSSQYPNNNFITLEQALRYCGDNSTHSKRALIKMVIIWFFYGVYLLSFSSLIGDQTSFMCKIDGMGDGFQCSKEIACVLDTSQIQLKQNNTLSQDFELYCGREFFPIILTSL